MEPNKIKELLQKRETAKQNLAAIQKSKETTMNSVLTEEIKEQLREIEEEYAPDIQRAGEVLKELEDDIKFYVSDLGETVRSDIADVVFYKGRKSWDTKGLEGYAVAHPEVLQFKKFGKPYAVIRDK